MAIHEVLVFPDPRLREVGKPVDDIQDPKIQELIDDMYETMYAYHGAGLAATQINVQYRIIVIDDSPDKSEPRELINPEIIERSGEQMAPEGCLSVPGFYEDVSRANWVKVKYFDRKGNEHTAEGEDRMASVYQHEIDHLDGKLYVDYLSRLKQQRIRRKLEKFRRLNM